MSKFTPLTNFQINEYMKKNKSYGGTLAKDQLPKKIQKKSYIINFDKSDQGGSHWICVYNKKNNECLYYDSFGAYPPPEIYEWMKGSGKTLLRNNEQIQDIQAVTCGYYCINMIDRLDNGESFTDILYSYDYKPKDNEKQLKQYFNNKSI